MAMFIPFMGKLIRRFGKKEICSAGLAVAAIVNFIMFAMRNSALAQNPYFFLILVFFSGAGQTFLVLEVWALVMDVIDYQEKLSGRREEGTTYAFFSFTRKLGQTLAGVGSAALLGAIGYDGRQIEQSAEVLPKLYDISTLIPAITLLLMFVLLKFGYPLSKKKLMELKAENANLE